MVEHRTRVRKVQISAGAAGGFSSSELTSCPFHPMLSQWHVKKNKKQHRLFCQSAGGGLNLNTHTHLTHRTRSGLTILSRHCVGTYQGNDLTRSSSGNPRPQSSQLPEPLWTDPGLKSGIGVRELISTLKEEKKRRRGSIHQ